MLKSKSATLIPVAAPWITEREGELAKEAALGGWGPQHYRFNEKFENEFAEYIGVKHAISLPHATAGIHLALAALGIGPDDEVICPDVTWIASTAPVSYMGATPVFVDILFDTWCISPERVREAITPNTKAIIAVNLYGSMCDWIELRKIANENNIPIIEDAAESFGSEFNSQMAGSFGDISVFSFHGSKTMTTGEGGMLVTNRRDLFERSLKLRDHGRSPEDKSFESDIIGFKYKMSAVQAAIGIAQLEKANQLLDYKRQLFRLYKRRFEKISDISFNYDYPGVYNPFWMVTVILGPSYHTSKDQLRHRLLSFGIDTRPFFPRLSKLKPYYKRSECVRHMKGQTVGDLVCPRGINLPSGFGLTEADVDYICDKLEECIT